MGWLSPLQASAWLACGLTLTRTVKWCGVMGEKSGGMAIAATLTASVLTRMHTAAHACL